MFLLVQQLIYFRAVCQSWNYVSAVMLLSADQVTKSEKEIMRPLYNRYRALKQMLAAPTSVTAYFMHDSTDIHLVAR